MSDLKCCRTCLATNKLNPIFQDPNKSESYSQILLLTTGLKIEINDNLPQLICTKCVNIINKQTQFLEQCCSSQATLLNRISVINSIKIELDEDAHNISENNINMSENDRNMSENDRNMLENDGNVSENDRNILENERNMSDNDFDEDTGDSNDNFEMTVKDSLKREIDFKIKDLVPKKRVKLKDDEVIPVKKECSDVSNKRGPFECKYCKKILKTRSSLHGHLNIHMGKKIICEHCGMKCLNQRRWLMHCRAKHGYERIDKCSFCDYKGNSPECVKVHERVHTGEKPYVCAECGAGFHRKSSHLQHIAIHLPEKTVQCDQCPARFKSVTLMKIHKNRHRESKFRFRCELCGNTFARRVNVARHLANVHNMTPDPKHIQRLKLSD